jgi:hypothetical protein
MLYILEVQKFNPSGHLLQSEWNCKSTHVGYMNIVFKTKNQACEYYDNHNNTMRPLNSYNTYRSDWNRDTHLLYVVREYGDEYLSIPPFEENGKNLVIEQFIADNIEHAPGGHISKKMLNNVFKEWFQTNYLGRKIPKLMEIELAMNEKFEVKTNKYGFKEWINIKINCDDMLDNI